jgi:basic membrane protein A
MIMRKQFLCAVLILCCAAAVVSARAGRDTASSGRMKVALLLSGPANDQGWNATAFEGLKEAETRYGLETAFTENLGIPDGDGAYTDYASQGYDLIIGHGFQFGDPAVRVSAKFPGTKFMAIESNVFSTNAASYVMACEEAGYLMGILSASVSRTGKIGMVGGFEQPSIIKVVEAYKLGARLVNPDIIIYDVYINSYTDVALGKEAALSIADNGADVISHIANQAGTGVIKAAEERGLLSTGDSYDQNSIAPDTVICSTVYSVPQLVLSAVDKVKNNTFIGGVFNLGMRDGVIDIAPYHGFENRIPQQVKDMIADYRSRIVSGAFKVPLIETRTY